MSFLDPLLNGALTTDSTEWVSSKLPNGFCQKANLIVDNTTANQTLDTIGRAAGSLTNAYVTTIYAVVTMFEIAGLNSPDAAEFQLKGVWYRNGGSLVAVKAPVVIDSNPNAHGTPWTAALVASGTGVIVRVTCDTGKTVRCSSLVTYYEG